MYQRLLQLPKNKSFFLFGARGTGKTTLISKEFDKNSTHSVNLLDLDLELRYRRDPMSFEREVLALPQTIDYVVVDEIQKIPSLLDVVHNLIETHKVRQRFILTGSSARKLKSGGANLLAGRAALRSLFPLTFEELGGDFDAEKAISYGGLPAIWNMKTEEDYDDFLRSYANIYLKEEVWNEQFVRNLDPFRHFLEVAALQSGKIINYRKIALDVGVDTKTVQTWYSILEDTLIGYFLDAYHSSVRKQLRQSPKFYFFDTGVTRALAQILSIKVTPQTSQYGFFFEQMVLNHLMTKNIYLKRDYKFHYLLTKSGVEIDLIIKKPDQSLILIEIKSCTEIRPDHCQSLLKFKNDFPQAKFMLFSQDKKRQNIEGVECVYWMEGIKEL